VKPPFGGGGRGRLRLSQSQRRAARDGRFWKNPARANQDDLRSNTVRTLDFVHHTVTDAHFVQGNVVLPHCLRIAPERNCGIVVADTRYVGTGSDCSTFVPETFANRGYTQEAVKFIHNNKDRPFFLYLPHTAVHVPLHPGAGFKGKSANGAYGDWVEEVDWSVGEVLDRCTAAKARPGRAACVSRRSPGGRAGSPPERRAMRQ
jgi:hypothetical protein